MWSIEQQLDFAAASACGGGRPTGGGGSPAPPAPPPWARSPARMRRSVCTSASRRRSSASSSSLVRSAWSVPKQSYYTFFNLFKFNLGSQLLCCSEMSWKTLFSRQVCVEVFLFPCKRLWSVAPLWTGASGVGVNELRKRLIKLNPLAFQGPVPRR